MLRGLIFTLALCAPTLASAATLGTFTVDYGTFTDTDGGNAGTYDLVVGTPFSADPVFTDSFDISSLAGEIIEELVVTITYGGSLAFPTGSAWFFDVYGADAGSSLDDVSVALTQEPAGGLSSVTVTAANTTDAFLNAIANLRVDFGFREETGGYDVFRIYDATLVVNGTAVVPLPAPVFLLLLALASLTLHRRHAALQPVRVKS